MTIGSDVAASGPFYPDGIATAFAFAFEIDAAADLKAVWLGLDGSETVISSASYAVTISAVGPGGTVTFAVAPRPPVAGDQLWFYLDPVFEQQDRYSDEGPFNQSLLERTADKAVRLAIALKEKVERSILVPRGTAGGAIPAQDIAGKYLAFDANGSPTASAGTGADAGLRPDLATINGRNLVGGIIYPAASRVILAALNTAAFQQALLTEGERAGIFEWRAGDYSAFVSIDPAQGVYVPPATDPTGASGVWKRRTEGNDVRPEWFGAIGNYRSDNNTGNDDTAGIQAALDFASLTGLASIAGSGPIPIVRLSAKSYLTSNVSLRWLSQVRGEERTSATAVWAKNGTAGVFWGVDDDESPQKVVLRNIAWYGRGINTITDMVKLNSSAPAVGSGQHGTEGGLFDLWIRDAPEAVGLNVNGNVGYYQNITIQNCRVGLQMRGNGNIAHTITLMQIGQGALNKSAAYALDVAGLKASGIHIEAPEGDVPVRFLRGDVQIYGLTWSPGAGTVHDRLFEIDDTYASWAIRDLQIYNPGNITVTTACLRYGFVDSPGTFKSKLGTAPSHLNGRDLTRNEVLGRRFMGRAKFQAFKVRINNNAGTIQFSISPAKLNGGTPVAELIDRITGASTTAQTIGTAFNNFGLAFDQDSGNANRIMFNTVDQAFEELAHISSVTIDINKSAYANLKAAPGVYSVTAGDAGAAGAATAARPVIDFYQGDTTKADLTAVGALPNNGDLIQVTIQGWFA